MQDRGYKALTTFVKEIVYQAMKKYAAEAEMSHSSYLAKLIEEDLKRKGYLAPPPPLPGASKRVQGR